MGRDVAERRSFHMEYWIEDEIEEAEVTEGWFKVIHTWGKGCTGIWTMTLPILYVLKV